jgi:hypothetical protein
MNSNFVRHCAVNLLIMMVFMACASHLNIKKSTIEIKPLDKEAFIFNPFGYEPNIKNFSAFLPSNYKLQIYTTKNKFYPNIVDSIFRFYHKKNELFVYKTNSKRELFMAGNIYDHNIILHNGVKIGMERNDFFKCFNDLKTDLKDTLRISSKHGANSYNFIFSDDKLKAIKIDNYID